ncbi:MAG: rhomboid family intramembrane serine protease [Flavobacteriales bacterium]
MSAIVDDIKNNFKKSNIVIKLIYVNVAVFLALLLVRIIAHLFLFDSILVVQDLFMMPTSFGSFILQPWSIITHMFTQVEVMHILFNMLMLYFMGQMFVQFFGEKKALSVYLLGGFSGGLILLFATAFLPAFKDVNSIALGASAAVMAITIAVCAYSPRTTIHLFGIVPLELRYFGLIIILLDLLSIGSGSENLGGHLAHVGGAIFGFYFATKYVKGKDITKGFTKFLDSFFNLFKKKSSLYVSHPKVRQMDDYEYNYTKKTIQEKVDEILDKISRSGYDSLTKEEKDILHKSSRM